MAKQQGHGVKLDMSDGMASATFATVAQVETIQPPGWTQGVTAVPTHDDAAGGGIEKIADALYDGGEVTLTILEDLDDATHDETTGLRSLKGASTARDFQLIYPNSLGQIDFAAFLTSYAPQGIDANSGQIRADVTLEISGDTTHA